MHHTADRIIGKPSDYKQCTRCGSINWYENENCKNCDAIISDTETLDNNPESVQKLKDDFEGDPDAELDV